MNYALYPYNDELEIYLDKINIYRQDINVVVAVHPKSIRIKSKVRTCIELSDDFIEALKSVDAVLFVEGLVYKDILSKIEYAVCRVRKVICCHILLDSDLEYVKTLCQKYNTEFEYQKAYTDIADLLKKRGDPFTLQECAVMGIASLTQGIITDEAVICLSMALRSKGYRVTSVVSSRNLIAYGFYYLPYDELFSVSADLDQFVIQLNRFFSWLQFRERPDIILVQFCDESLIQFSSKLAYGFGIKSFILSQALAVDYSLLFSPYGTLDDFGFNKVSECFSHRFGFHIDAVCFEPRIIDQLESVISAKIIYRKVQDKGEEFVKGIKEDSILYINKHQAEKYYLVADDFISKLS